MDRESESTMIRLPDILRGDFWTLADIDNAANRIEELEAELARARDALSNWYGDGSFSANTVLGGHTDWCIDHCWPGATEPRGDDDEVLDSVFVDDHADCICGWQSDKAQP